MPRSSSLDRLRLAAALAHRVPGTTLELRCANGSLVTVGPEPEHDLDPCHFRRVVVGSSFPGAADLSSYLSAIRLLGAADLGGGLHGTVSDQRADCWFATLLRPERVRELLDARSAGLPEDQFEGGLAIDRQLAVTVVRLSGVDRDFNELLTRLARPALSACLVDEVIQAAQRDRIATPPRHTRPFRDRP